MPHGTKKRSTCSSKGGTRKQRGGFPGFSAFTSAAKQAAKQAAELKKSVNAKIDKHLDKNPTLKSGLSSARSVAASGLSSARSAAQGVTQRVTATGSQMMNSDHARDIKKHMSDVHTSLKNAAAATSAGAASAARTAARNALNAAIIKYEKVFGNDAMLTKMKDLLAHQVLNPNANANMGGRKKHGHKKRAHKKRHATKKRRHKKHRGSRKRRGGAPCPCNA